MYYYISLYITFKMNFLERIEEFKRICGLESKPANASPTNQSEYIDTRQQNEDTNTEVSESVATNVRQQNQTKFINITQQPRTLTGGFLKYYQMESLQFLLNIHAMSERYNAHFQARHVRNIENYQVNAILADEMGLGKTIQTLAVLSAVYEHYGVKGKHLIVVPKSTMI